MSYVTKPGYTAPSQAVITSEVPDLEDGVIAYAVSERTAWQLSLTSVASLGANVIATRSGIGRWIRFRYAVSGRPVLVWNANGDLGLFSVDAAAPSGDGGDSFFDGARYVSEGILISGFSMSQRSTGDSGDTVAEVYRYRAGVFTLLATLTITAGSVIGVTTAPAPASPDDELAAGDVVMCRFTGVQAASATLVPQDVVVQLEST